MAKGATISKTKARGQWIDGTYWRSEAELHRYRVLKQREKEGLIHDLQLQPKYNIRHPETGEKVCTYIADFAYLNRTYNLVVEDVKGMRTPVFILKSKLVRVFLGIRIVEVVPRPVTRNRQVIGYRWKVNGEWEA